MSEIIVTITNNEIKAYLSVDGREPVELGLVDMARLLSDLAMATTATVVAGYERRASDAN